jgi:hypothetical protein
MYLLLTRLESAIAHYRTLCLSQAGPYLNRTANQQPRVCPASPQPTKAECQRNICLVHADDEA